MCRVSRSVNPCSVVPILLGACEEPLQPYDGSSSALVPAPARTQTMDHHSRARSLVGPRVVVEAPVEVERNGPLAVAIGIDDLGDVGMAGQRPVVRDRVR